MPSRKSTHSSLQDALLKSYVARAKLFYSALRGKNIAGLFSKIEQIQTGHLDWNLPGLGIDACALSAVKKAKLEPAQIFCHPEILQADSDALEYYRNLAALSRKGLAQLLSGHAGKPVKGRKVDRQGTTAGILNRIISAVIIDTKPFTLSLAQNVILAEIGTEIQGTWANFIGKGAARAVEEMIEDYAKTRGYISAMEKKQITLSGKKHKQAHIVLTNGWRIIFSSEPDVAVRDPQNRLQSAIEIKGSMDKAGAQTRLGEAKKSFAKAKSENAHCRAVYLASCFTDAVLAQLKTEREVDQHFNLVDILADPSEKAAFLRELFHYLIRIE